MTDYGNVFYPSGPDTGYNRSIIGEILLLDTLELKQEQIRYERLLEELRAREPSRKRKNKAKYKLWISRTHDYLEVLTAITEELISR